MLSARKTVQTYAVLAKCWTTPLKTDMVLYLRNWMQFLNCEVEAFMYEGDWRKPILTLASEKEQLYYPGDTAGSGVPER